MINKLQAGDQPNFAEYKSNVPAEEYGCVQCGRRVGKNPWYVEIIDGGVIRLQDGTPAVEDSGYMGCYPVGNECAKSFDKSVLLKLNLKASK